jgi:flagellar biosynthesis/type III secretory pathway protein FliH
VVASIQTTLTDRVTLSADESLRPGECVIESDAGWLDGRLETQLEQVRAALSGLLNTAGYQPSEPRGICRWLA